MFNHLDWNCVYALIKYAAAHCSQRDCHERSVSYLVSRPQQVLTWNLNMGIEAIIHNWQLPNTLSNVSPSHVRTSSHAARLRRLTRKTFLGGEFAWDNQKQVGQESAEDGVEWENRRERPRYLLMTPPLHVNTGPEIRCQPCCCHGDCLFAVPTDTTGNCSQRVAPLFSSEGGCVSNRPCRRIFHLADFPCLECITCMKRNLSLC